MRVPRRTHAIEKRPSALRAGQGSECVVLYPPAGVTATLGWRPVLFFEYLMGLRPLIYSIAVKVLRHELTVIDDGILG